MCLSQIRIIETAGAIFGQYVKEVQVGEVEGHLTMNLIYNNNHRMCIIQTSPAERILAEKWLNQAYCIVIKNPEGKTITEKKYLTAKMVKMAILKTKKLDILKRKLPGFKR